MDKMGYDHGLVRYASEHTLAGGQTQWLRPRLLGYGTVFFLMTLAFGYALTHIAPLEVGVSRDRGALFTETKSGDIANTYSLHVFNKTASDARYDVDVENRPGARLLGPSHIDLPAGTSKTVVYQVQLPLEAVVSPRLPITFLIAAAQDPALYARVQTTFLGPDRR
jgi:polyferredoxin